MSRVSWPNFVLLCYTHDLWPNFDEKFESHAYYTIRRRRNSFQVGRSKTFDTRTVIFPDGRRITTFLQRN